MSTLIKPQKTWLPLCILFVLSLPLFFIKISDKQTWGDDFAQYIQEAKNIAEGIPYHTSGYIFNDLNQEYAPASYPPGFPLLLAPIVRIFGTQIAPMLYLITFLVFGLSFVLFFYFRRFSNHTLALCLALMVVYSPGVLNLKGYVLSDLPLLVLTAIYFLLRKDLKLSVGSIFSLALVATFSILTRSQAILILGAEILWMIYLFIKKGFKSQTWAFIKPSAMLCLTTCFLFLSINFLFLKSSHEPLLYYTSFFSLYGNDFWVLIGENFNLLLGMFSEFFIYNHHAKNLAIITQVFSYSLMALAFVGCFEQLRTGPRVEFFYFVLMCLLILFLPVRQGLRFFIPVLPAYLCLVCTGWSVLVSRFKWRFTTKPVIAIVALYLASGFQSFGAAPFEDWTPYTPKDSLAFKYLRQNIKKGEVVVFIKPRALTLFTGLSTLNVAWARSLEENKRKFDSVQIKYMLTRTDMRWDKLDEYFRKVPPIDTTTIGDLYTLYRMN